MRNIGFLMAKKQFPENYKDIDLVFHDLDNLIGEKNLVDFSIGRKVGPIQLDIAATNLFDQKYRAYPGMPIIERTVILKAGFNF